MSKSSKTARIAFVLLALATVPAAAMPPDSDTAAAQNGGGCYPTGISPGLFDLLRLVDPEWAPVVSGMTVDSTPVYFHGTVAGVDGAEEGDRRRADGHPAHDRSPLRVDEPQEVEEAGRDASRIAAPTVLGRCAVAVRRHSSCGHGGQGQQDECDPCGLRRFRHAGALQRVPFARPSRRLPSTNF